MHDPAADLLSAAGFNAHHQRAGSAHQRASFIRADPVEGAFAARCLVDNIVEATTLCDGLIRDCCEVAA